MASARRRLIPLAALLACCAAPLTTGAPLQAQDEAKSARTLTGIVVEAETGVPIPGASVALVGRRQPVYSDAQGRFTLSKLPPGPHMLMVTQLGYDTLTTTLDAGEDAANVVLQLRPDPVILQGVQVVSDRLRRRRNAVATSVRAFDQSALQTGAARSALEFVQTRTSLMSVPCINRLSVASCAYVRGRPSPVSVYIDDSPIFGGLEVLDMYRPEDLYLVEVYSGGRQVRVYTNWYIAWSARKGRLPPPVLW